MNRLLNIGFQCVGHWTFEGGTPAYELRQHFNTPNVLYAFICNNEVLYVGKTIRPLRQRMYGYKKGLY